MANLETVSSADTGNAFLDEILLSSIASTIRIDGTEFSFHDLTQEDTPNLDGIHFEVANVEVKFEDNAEDRPSKYGRRVRIVCKHVYIAGLFCEEGNCSKSESGCM